MPCKHSCSLCGFEHSTRVRYVEDPFAGDVYGKVLMVWMCDDCIQRSADDV